MTEESHHSVLALAMAVAIGILFGGLALSMALWLIGGLFHVLFWFARLATIVALGAGFVYLLSRRRQRANAS